MWDAGRPGRCCCWGLARRAIGLCAFRNEKSPAKGLNRSAGHARPVGGALVLTGLLAARDGASARRALALGQRLTARKLGGQFPVAGAIVGAIFVQARNPGL